MALLALTVFQIGSGIFAQVSMDLDPPIYASQVAEITGMNYCTCQGSTS
jgi:hypothetical protein